MYVLLEMADLPSSAGTQVLNLELQETTGHLLKQPLMHSCSCLEEQEYFITEVLKLN
jgi:hypothetical protein